MPESMMSRLFEQWRSDPSATYRSWFLWDERLKNFRSIRRGISQVVAEIDSGTFGVAYRGSSLETVVHSIAEQRQIFRMPGYRFGLARAADMTIEADHRIGRRHDEVEIVRNQQHAAAAPVAESADPPIELGLAADIDALRRLVHHQKIGLRQQGARKQQPLELAAGQILHRALGKMPDAELGERGLVLVTHEEADAGALRARVVRLDDGRFAA